MVPIKLNPASKETGLAVVRESQIIDTKTGKVIPKIPTLNLFQITHRGQAISQDLTSRRSLRRRRRGNLRYRKALFDNQARPKGWFPPSFQHRFDATMSLVNKLRRLVLVIPIAIELVRFDKSVVMQGKKVGTYIGKVAVPPSDYFNITTKEGTAQSITYKCCTLIARSDGYGYEFQTKTA